MKHTFKVTAIILAMFLLTQVIGMYVVNHYSSVRTIDGISENVTAPEIPFGLETQEPKDAAEFNQVIIAVVIAFVIAIALLFFLMHFKAEFLLKFWFFAVVTIALGIAFVAFMPEVTNKYGISFTSFDIPFSYLIALVIALPLAIIKIFKRNFWIHNLTELFIYPGIAAVFAPLLNFYTVILLLLIISAYDMWAVWRSGVMQKMAKYQIDKLKIFSGFFVPYMNKKTKAMIKKAKTKKELIKKKIKVNIAILGGGDVIFPIITAGVMLRIFGYVSMFGINVPLASILVLLGAAFGLTYLFFFAEKKKFYPAMPFITSGILIGIGLSWIIYSKLLGIPVNFGFLF